MGTTAFLLLFAQASTEAALRDDAIQARIRKYRMADLTVTVRDAQGKPIQGATVHVEQKRHAFLFGANVLELRTYIDEPWQKAYQDRYAALFNFASVGFFWDGYEPQPGKPIDGFIGSQVDWLRAHNIAMMGTPLVWHMSYPGWAPKDADATIPLLKKHLETLIDRNRKDVRIWIVDNEALSVKGFDSGVARWTERDGPARVVGTTLDWARAAAKPTPEAMLYNDWEVGDPYPALLERLQKVGKLPDGIGIQAHMHQGTRSMADWWSICERFARFGKPLYFTESTVLSGPTRKGDQIPYSGPPATDWNTTPEGEAAQADYVERFYTLLFSHPLMRAINWWDLSDRSAWLGAPSGLLRKDMTPKPAYDRLMTLFHRTWWTSASGVSDPRGSYTVHAFYGDYAVTASDAQGHAATQTIVWDEASGPKRVAIALR